jgi:hypothetical protein
MRNLFLVLASVIAVCLIPKFIQAGDHVIDTSKDIELLYVLNAKSGSFKEDKLTLNGVPLVVYFSERPYRFAGHKSVKKLVDNWCGGISRYKADPPNATFTAPILSSMV